MIASTGVGPVGFFVVGGIVGSSVRPAAPMIAVVGVAALSMAASSTRLGARSWVADLDVAPAPELASVVDGGAPLVAGGRRPSPRSGPGDFWLAGHLDDQRALDVVVGSVDEPDQEVGHVPWLRPSWTYGIVKPRRSFFT